MAALAYLNGDGDKVAKETVTPNICIEADNASNFTAAGVDCMLAVVFRI